MGVYNVSGGSVVGYPIVEKPSRYAVVAQLVERQISNLNVARSCLVYGSIVSNKIVWRSVETNSRVSIGYLWSFKRVWWFPQADVGSNSERKHHLYGAVLKWSKGPTGKFGAYNGYPR